MLLAYNAVFNRVKRYIKKAQTILMSTYMSRSLSGILVAEEFPLDRPLCMLYGQAWAM